MTSHTRFLTTSRASCEDDPDYNYVTLAVFERSCSEFSFFPDELCGLRGSDGKGLVRDNCPFSCGLCNSVFFQIGSDIEDKAPDDNFGRAVILSSEGFTLAISSYRNDGNGDYLGHFEYTIT